MMKKDIPIGFTLLSLKINEFATIKNDKIELKGVTLDTSFTFGLNFDTNEISTTCKVIFDFKDIPFIILEATCSFDVEAADFATMTKPKNGVVTIPQSIATHFGSVAVGTVRGILHTKLENTDFSQYMLPLIDIAGIISKDILFKLPVQAGSE